MPMKIYKYWGMGEAEVFTPDGRWMIRRYGPSNISLEDAKRQATAMARRSAEAIQNDEGVSGDDYGYTDRPVREEIIEEFYDGEQRIGAITRNSHGSLILNTSSLFFADIDYPLETHGGSYNPIVNFLNKLFSPKRPNPDHAIFENIQRVVDQSPGMGVRVYRTYNGFRVMINSDLYDPDAEATKQLLEEFDSDKLYIRMCRAQSCFRARLTPKHWRCGAPKPPQGSAGFPFETAQDEATYRAWEQAYHTAADGYATCVLVFTYGVQDVLPALQTLVNLHDQYTCTNKPDLA